MASPPLILLDRSVLPYPPEDDPEHVLTSGYKLAIGFAQHDEANSAVQSLELTANFAGETDLSYVTLRGGYQYSSIHTVDKNLILISSSFLHIFPFDVFLIYDAIDNSLRMIPTVPQTHPSLRTARVLVARPLEDDGDYALVYPGTGRGHDAVHVARPTSTSSLPWETKMANFPDCIDYSWFEARAAFSFRGRGYWVDFFCGVLYCDCNEVFSDDINCVEFRYLDLPVGCKYSGYKEDVADAKAFRAMGPAGDSIKFVSIEGYLEHVDLKECKVMVWTLMADLNWTVEYELKFSSLCAGGDFSGHPVPQGMAPMYPFLSTEEDDVIYFALGNLIRGEKNCFPTQPSRMVCVDLHSKTFKCTKLSESQRTYISSHFALPGNAAEKLLSGSSGGGILDHMRTIRNLAI